MPDELYWVTLENSQAGKNKNLPPLLTPTLAMLKQPDPAQISHSKRLLTLIKQEIFESAGQISFERYMEMALYAPGLGYYSVGTEKLGEAGDFITAPMLGQQFAHCLAKQVAEIKQNFHGHFDVMEFGAGTGQLALDFLNRSNQLFDLPDRYIIIETSPDLKNRQQQLFKSAGAEFLDVVHWYDVLPEEKITGVIIANEVLDAMPVIRFQISEDAVAQEMGVKLQGENLVHTLLDNPLSLGIQEKLSQYSLPSGYQGEYGQQGQAWIRSIAESLASGVVLLVDYGFPGAEYYHPDRQQGSLMCHYQHIAHGDAFYYPGLQDITAHVDFSAIAEVANSVGMSTIGYCGQGSFLLSLGLLDDLIESQKTQTNTKQSMMLSQEIKKLTLPHEMGELFKVMALGKNYKQPLSGFEMQNHSGRL